MKKIIALFTLFMILILSVGCKDNNTKSESEISAIVGVTDDESNASGNGDSIDSSTDASEEASGDTSLPDISQEDNKDEEKLRAIWISQFDLNPMLRANGAARSIDDFKKSVDYMIGNLTRDGFDTIYLQVRPNGDSFYESDIYPASKYIAGSYGGRIPYDAIGIILDKANANGISVHAWINPFRLSTKDELEAYGKGQLYEWYLEGIGKRIEVNESGQLYLDPAYPEATEMIVDGVREILTKYDFDGIHIDDYFYPTGFEFEDDEEFKKSGYSSKKEFRMANISKTVKALYDITHSFEGKVFGVSPAGNIHNLANNWYADVYKWCSEDGYLDYVIPQLYFGFENSVCPYESILQDWVKAVTNVNIELYIGLSAAKCESGTKGDADTYAGEGKYEWRDNKDILARSTELADIYADGVCIFTYSSFYNPINGQDNQYTTDEKQAFCEVDG